MSKRDRRVGYDMTGLGGMEGDYHKPIFSTILATHAAIRSAEKRLFRPVIRVDGAQFSGVALLANRAGMPDHARMFA